MPDRSTEQQEYAVWAAANSNFYFVCFRTVMDQHGPGGSLPLSQQKTE